jgi:malonate transporter and related proteins
LENVVNVTLPFFALIGCGYAAARFRLFPTDAIGGLNAFVWYFALPSLVFRGIALRPVAEILDIPFIAAWMVAAWSIYILTGALGRIFFKAPFGVSLLQGQGASLSNIGYMGLPLLIALAGEKAAVPAILAMLTDMVLVQTPTMALLELARNRKGQPLATAARVLRGFVRNPLVLAVAVAATVAGLAIPVPDAVTSFTGLLGQAAGPCALFAIGAKLAGQPVADRFGEVAFMSLGKLIAHPIAVWLATYYLFDIDPERALIAVLLAALPIGGNLFVVAQNFGIYAARSSTAILVSTAVSVATFSARAAWRAP